MLPVTLKGETRNTKYCPNLLFLNKTNIKAAKGQTSCYLATNANRQLFPNAHLVKCLSHEMKTQLDR